MGALSARSVRKRRAISDFCKTLPLEERAKFDKKTEGWCSLLTYILIDYIQRFNCLIDESPNFCFSNGATANFSNGATAKDASYVLNVNRIYIKKGEDISPYNYKEVKNE